MCMPGFRYVHPFYPELIEPLATTVHSVSLCLLEKPRLRGLLKHLPLGDLHILLVVIPQGEGKRKGEERIMKRTEEACWSAHTCKASTLEAEAGGLAQSHPQQVQGIVVSLSYP